mgnify:CR=1 FL=1
MSAFGVGIQTLPGYASNIVIELRRERALQADVLPQYFVTVVYNDTESVRVVHVPGCPTDQESCEFTMCDRELLLLSTPARSSLM